MTKLTTKVRVALINSFKKYAKSDLDLINKYIQFIKSSELLQTSRDLHELVWLSNLRGEEIVKILREKGVKSKYIMIDEITPNSNKIIEWD